MRAYLITSGGEPDPTCADAWVVDARSAPSSSRAGGEAIRGQGADIAALNGFASLAMTRGISGKRTVPLLIRIEGIDAIDRDELAEVRPDAIMLSSAHGRDIAHLGAQLAVHEAEHGLPDGGIGIIALVVSAAGVLATASFAGASPRLRGIGWDAALASELGAEPLTDEGDWSPVLAQARAMARLAASAAGVAAIEAAYPGKDPRKVIGAARRDGFAAMFARDARQAQAIRGES
ncbi:hypothetical protein [Methylobacterium gnaphalii]|uniref:hypothetical protein n=1 Tax=Methylobacterium gnaphalii TaxID=1010610 RepID=UPI001EE2EE22|nr:hypothetical protein [Methylobacterium gnaphalii]